MIIKYITAWLYIAGLISMLGYQAEKTSMRYLPVSDFLRNLTLRLIIAAAWPVSAPVMFVRSWDESIDDDCKEDQE